MNVRRWPRGLQIGLAVAVVGLIVAFALGLVAEAFILLATLTVCSVSLVPLWVERGTWRRPAERRSAHPEPVRRPGSGAQAAS